MTNATFLEKLADGSSGLHGSSERLALLGKRAAGMYLSKEAESLTGAVARVAEEEPDLNADQLRRISESANQATWKEMFVVKGDRDTQFEPADSERVIEDVTKRPQEVRDLNLDYAMEPRGEQLPDLNLHEVFGVGPETPYPLFDETGDIRAEQEKVAGAIDLMGSDNNHIFRELTDSAERFYGFVKHAYLTEENGFLQVAKAVSSVTEHGFADRVMNVAADRLKAEGVYFDQRAELSKLAQVVVVDTEHPLLIEAVRLEKLAAAYGQVTRGLEKLGKKQKELRGALHSKLRGA